MVEAIRTNETRIRQYYSDGILTREEEVPVFKAGKRFVCTVTNRSAVTLLPIIYKYVLPGSIIRSDGWGAYRGLHPREWTDRETGELRVASRTQEHYLYTPSRKPFCQLLDYRQGSTKQHQW